MIADIHLVLEPDTIVPSQFFATVRRQAPTYHVTFWGSGYTARETVEMYLLYRCLDVQSERGTFT